MLCCIWSGSSSRRLGSKPLIMAWDGLRMVWGVVLMMSPWWLVRRVQSVEGKFWGGGCGGGGEPVPVRFGVGEQIIAPLGQLACPPLGDQGPQEEAGLG